MDFKPPNQRVPRCPQCMPLWSVGSVQQWPSPGFYLTGSWRSLQQLPGLSHRGSVRALRRELHKRGPRPGRSELSARRCSAPAWPPAGSSTWIPSLGSAGRLVSHWHLPALNFKTKPKHTFWCFWDKRCWNKSLPCQVSAPALSHLPLPLLKLPCVYKRGFPLKFYTKILWVWGEEADMHSFNSFIAITVLLTFQLYNSIDFKEPQELQEIWQYKEEKLHHC